MLCVSSLLRLLHARIWRKTSVIEREKKMHRNIFLSFLPSKNYSELENELPMNKLRPYISELFMK